jgi:transcriptional regulator GlxA family with amidase domain
MLSQCLVLMFRRLSELSDHKLAWLDALEDPRLARVIGEVLDRPEQPHTLEGLAELAGMSRSVSVAAHRAEVVLALALRHPIEIGRKAALAAEVAEQAVIASRQALEDARMYARRGAGGFFRWGSYSSTRGASNRPLG